MNNNGITVWATKTYEPRQFEWFPDDIHLQNYLNMGIELTKLHNICKKSLYNNNCSINASKVAASVVIGLIIDSTTNIFNKHCI